jgi:quercetin dioxygenase-like cupin family protein
VTDTSAPSTDAFDTTGWTFGDANEVEWQAISDKVAMKMLGAADGVGIALFRFAEGYEGGTHHHDLAEFGYVLEGSIVANGVTLAAGQGYAAKAGTDHHQGGTDGAVILSVFKLPS